jgi:hypothetical protein
VTGASPALPPQVVAFLDEHIFSVTQLEVLLMVRELAPGAITVQQLSRAAHLPERSIRPWLDAFVERGLLAHDDPDGYRSPELDPTRQAVVDAVADCYAKRRVSLSRHVYASREDPARRFADAFRFRKDPPAGKDRDR